MDKKLRLSVKHITQGHMLRDKVWIQVRVLICSSILPFPRLALQECSKSLPKCPMPSYTSVSRGTIVFDEFLPFQLLAPAWRAGVAVLHPDTKVAQAYLSIRSGKNRRMVYSVSTTRAALRPSFLWKVCLTPVIAQLIMANYFLSPLPPKCPV